MLEERFRSVMNEEKHWSMVRGLSKTGDLLARSDLCHLHEGRAAAESCALDEKLQGQDRDVVLVARSGSNQHVWVGPPVAVRNHQRLCGRPSCWQGAIRRR